MKFSRLMPIVFGSLLLAQTAYPGTLGSVSSFGGLLTDQPSSDTTLSALIAVGPTSALCWVVGTCSTIALLENIDTAAAGSVHIIDFGSSAFPSIVSTFTNGVLDRISAGIVPGPSYGTSSGGAVQFDETAFGTSPDFIGQTIGSVSLRIDSVTIKPADLPNLGTSFRLDYTLTVNSVDVPEPATWLMMAAGGAALIALRRKRLEIS